MKNLRRTGFVYARLVVLALVFSPQPASAQSGTWTTKAASPIALGSVTGDVIGGLFYATGLDPALNGFLEVFDPATNIWTVLPAPPIASAHASAAAINGKLYVVGGCAVDADCELNTTGLLQVYDPGANAWSTLAAMPAARSAAAVGVINGKLYVVSGLGACTPCNQVSETDVYDPSTNTWNAGGPLAPIPAAAEFASAAVMGGKLYVAGGFHRDPADPTGGLTTALDTLQVYDPGSNSWSPAASMPSARGAAAAAAFGGRIYVIGGRNVDGSTAFAASDAYDPGSDTWTARPNMPTARHGLAGAAAGPLFYALGGVAPGVPYGTVLEVYSVAPVTSASRSPLPNGNGWNNGDVTVTLNGTDNSGTGLASICEAMTGAQVESACSPANPFALPVHVDGITTLTYHAIDNAGDVEADHSVTLKLDRTPPAIAPLSNITVNATSSSGAVVSFNLSTLVSDPLSGVVSISTSPISSGQSFPNNTTHLTVTAQDAAGNASTSGFDVTVVPDNQPPTSTASANPPPTPSGWHNANNPNVSVTFNANDPAPGTGLQRVNWSLSGASSGNGFSSAPGGVNPSITNEGVTVVSYSAIDNAGNTESIHTLSIRFDKTSPLSTVVLVPPVNAAGWNNTSVTANLSATDPPNASNATAASGVASIRYSVGPTPTTVPGSSTSVVFNTDGQTNFGYSAGDVAGNQETNHIFGQIRIDRVAPSLTVPVGVSGSTSNPAGANVFFPGGSVSASDPQSFMAPGSPSCSPASGALFPIGTTLVTCTATDNAGNSTIRTFNAVVTATNPITFTFQTNSVEATGPAGAVANFNLTANDPAFAINSLSASPASGSLFAVGSNTVTASATDTAANSKSQAFTVTVTDRTPPTIHASDVTVASPDGNPVVVSFTATATDIVDPNPTVVITGVPAGSVFPLGSTTVMVTATDHASPPNSNSRSYDIFVTPQVAAVHATPASNQLFIGTTKQLFAVVDFPGGCSFSTDGTSTPECEALLGSGGEGGSNDSNQYWTVNFSPVLSTVGCNIPGGQTTFSSQFFSRASNGTVDLTWPSFQSPNVHVTGTMFPGVSANLTFTCSSGGATSGPIAFTWNNATASFTSGAFAFNGTNPAATISGWAPAVGMNTARAAFGTGTATVLGVTRIYAMGGLDGTTVLDSVEAYDPSTGTWTPGLASMVPARYGFAVAAVNNQLYAIGGFLAGGAPTNRVDVYDPAAGAGGTWTQVGSLLTARAGAAAVVSSGVIYAVGGVGIGGTLASVEALAATPGAVWVSKPSMPTPRRYPAAAVRDGVIYIFGGMTADDFRLGIVEAFDTASNLWSARSPMLVPSGMAGAAVPLANGLMFVGGGTHSEPLQAYDSTTDTWTMLASPLTERTLVAVSAVNNLFYVMGGQASDAFVAPAFNTVQVFSTAAIQGVAFGGQWLMVFSPPLYLPCFGAGSNSRTLFGAQTFSANISGGFTLSLSGSPLGTGTVTQAGVSNGGLSCGGTMTGSFQTTGGGFGQFTGTYTETTSAGVQTGTFTLKVQRPNIEVSGNTTGSGTPTWSLGAPGVTSNAVASISENGLVTALGAGSTSVIAHFGGSSCVATGTCATLTVVKHAPAFSNLISVATVYGTPAVTLTGTILGDVVDLPSGSIVTITIDGVSATAAVGAGGSFTASLNVGALPVGPHTIAYSYAGSALLDSALDTSTTLTIDAIAATTLTLKPATLGFGAQTVGVTSAEKVTILKNTGTNPLVVASVTATGAYAVATTCGTSVAPGASCSISVTFTPTATGAQPGAVVIADSGVGNPHSVGLSGSGISAKLTPANVSFGNQVMGTASVAKTLTVNNVTPLPQAVGTIGLVGDFAAASTCPPTLGAGATCTIAVTFTPMAPGTRSGGLTLTVGAVTLGTALTGNSIAVLKLSPGSLNFGKQPQGTTSDPKVVTISNPAALPIGGVTITASGDYAVSDGCAGSVPANGSCTATVTFTPAAAGARTGVLTVAYAGTSSPQTMNMSGTGTLDVTVTPKTLSFGKVTVGISSAPGVVTIENPNGVPIAVGAIVTTGGFSQVNSCAPAIAPGGSCTISVTFTPTAIGALTGTLTINDGASGSPQTVTLKGTGK